MVLVFVLLFDTHNTCMLLYYHTTRLAWRLFTCT